ncbi:MAG TPA: queuosine salvage family protein [Solirubrobacterales bacterium]|nr:queuosine salvage family protein [Solirubrobacterales bacterium]
MRIQEDAIGPYAAGLPAAAEPAPPDPATELTEGDRESRAAFVICLDAINFGSGWWPTIRKRPGHSGYFTVAAGLTERFRDVGPWSATELCELAPATIAAVLGQDAEHPLMADFAAALCDVGEQVEVGHGGRFGAAIDAAGGSASALADILAGWPAFADVSHYDGRDVPFFKRAQIAAADVSRMGLAGPPATEVDRMVRAAPDVDRIGLADASTAAEPGQLRDLDRLTAFADNLVPHVLRVDGVLRLDPALEQQIEAGQLLEHGSPEEVELRASAVQTIELLAAASPLTPAEIDSALWNRGRDPRYKSLPRPRSRNTAY